MKLLLLCLGLTLVCAHGQEKHDVVTSNFDMAKISGEWYTVLLAADSMEKIEENGSFRSFIEYIWVFDNSSLLLKYNKNSPYQTQILHLRNLKVVLIQRINGECTELFFVPDEKEEKGVYDVPYDGHNSIQIAEAVYDEYLILYVLNFDHEKTTNIIVLNARNLDVTPRLRKAFEKNCEKYGIPTENIVDVSNADPCIQTRGNHGSQSSSAE